MIMVVMVICKEWLETEKLKLKVHFNKRLVEKTTSESGHGFLGSIQYYCRYSAWLSPLGWMTAAVCGDKWLFSGSSGARMLQHVWEVEM